MEHAGTTHNHALVHGAGRSFCCDSPAHLAKYYWPAVTWQPNTTRPFFIRVVALFRMAWGRVLLPSLLRYAALPTVVAAGLVGHTYTELNTLARDVIGPRGYWLHCTARHAVVAVSTRLSGHTLHDVATIGEGRRN